MKLFIALGSINMAIAIAMGAFGAHGLRDKVEKTMLENWQTAAQYHMIHAIALLFVGLLIAYLGEHQPLIQSTGWLFLIGILFFSGSLYTLVLSDIRMLGAITPIGGVSFIVGWLLLAVATWKNIS